ncbi:MAG TPA: methylenetetrahydrofolate reductase [NAD(P)H] [Flavobacteriales bacterium]|jgi:methylenetetrahydrofolate reductase (NADPH)|nr:methylenetetrahydrofolate reductase [NAD(P)H] [Flavobacteriales bacterium]
MTITEILSQPGHSRFSIELLPPLKGQNIDSIYQTMDALSPFNPAFVDVTYHREEYVYREVGPGLLQKRTVRKRPGTVGICAALMNRYEIETVPHIICGGFSVEETENALIDLDFVGVRNVLALRGDAIRSEGRFKAEPEGHAYAIDLVDQIVSLNKGVYLDPDLRNTTATEFCIGVAGYPEKHFEAPNPDNDLRWLKKKVEHGAEYIITQMFFDNTRYFEFVDRCRAEGINIPIIPGIKPLTTSSQLQILPQVFHVDLPEALVESVEAAKTREQVKKAGMDWCTEQAAELLEKGAPTLHFYTMGKAHPTAEIARRVFGS